MKHTIQLFIVPIIVSVVLITIRNQWLIHAQESTPVASSSAGITTSPAIQLLPSTTATSSAKPTILVPITNGPTVPLDPTATPEKTKTDPIEKLNQRDQAPIIVDDKPPHQCKFEKFSQKVKSGDSVNYVMDAIIFDESAVSGVTLYLGDFPDGASASINRTDNNKHRRYNIAINTDSSAQKGSFNIPLVFKINVAEKTFTTICQFNLIVE